MNDELMQRVLAAVRRLFREVDPAQTFTADDYIHACGRGREALLYAALFCPPTVEVDDSVLLLTAVEEETDKQRFREYRAKKGRRAAESSFNFVEVPYLFGSHRDDLSDAEIHTLADMIAASWRSWLQAQYPGRDFAVEVLEPGDTGSVTGIHFFQPSTRAAP